MQDDSWLSSRVAAEMEVNTGRLAEVLRDYRATNGLTQGELAQLLHLDQSYISKIENGQRQVRDLDFMVRIANQLGIECSRLGLSAELLKPAAGTRSGALVGDVDGVAASQESWKRARRDLNGRRHELAGAAVRLYAPEARAGTTPFLAPASWLPRHPVRLASIGLEWAGQVAPPSVTGAEPEAGAVLPLRVPGRRFDRYTSAVRYVDPPALFENRPSYRLLHADLASSSPVMRFGLATYFDKLDVSEAVAHEFALAGGTAGWDALPLRALIGDPFDLDRRALVPAIETLSLRRTDSGPATFLLHWRDPDRVATAAGIYGLIPAGEFQPSSIASWDRRNDFDLWRNVVREYSEEVLGEPERDGSSGVPLDYRNWPLYRDLASARERGEVTAYCLGMGLDPLTLTATVLTAVVLDAHVFDALFGGAVRVNAEGVLISAAGSAVTDGVPFTEANVRRLLDTEPLAAPAACILDRAWRARDTILRHG